MPPGGEHETLWRKTFEEGSTSSTPERSTSEIVRFFSGRDIAFVKGEGWKGVIGLK